MIKRSPEALKEIEEYAKLLSEYDFKFMSGMFDVSDFVAHLFRALSIDRDKQPPFVCDMIDLLPMVLEANDVEEGVIYYKIENWDAFKHQNYPDGYRYLLSISPLFLVHAQWIFEIGELLPDRATDRGAAYLAWAHAEWTLTNIFLARFHSQMWEVLRHVDRESHEEKGYSDTEALDLATKSDFDFDEAVERLKSRNSGFKNAIKRVDQAIEAGFDIEAIAISESLMSACMHHFIKSMDVSNASQTFARLIKEFRKACGEAQHAPKQMIDDIDDWRKARNRATHNFVSRDIIDISDSQEKFLKEAKKTSVRGRDLCSRMLEWFEYESFFILKTDFDLPGPELN